MKSVNVMGVDAALANCGIAVASIDIESSKILRIEYLHTIKTKKTKERNIRVGEDNVRRAREIAHGLRETIAWHDVKFFFAEIPTGGQSANAATSFGIVQGLLASVSVPFFGLTPLELKHRAVGDKHADKHQIVSWATSLALAPDVKWPSGKAKNDFDCQLPDGSYVLKNAEHIADACAAIKAGITGNEFKRAAAMAASFL